MASSAPCAHAPRRVRICRPGTDVEGDTFVANLGGETSIIKGNVVLHSDPTVDKAFAATESDDPLTLTADEIDLERKTLRYVAKGHVHFNQGSREGNADTATLDEQTHDADLIGHARVFDGEHETKADRMHYNTQDKQFHGFGNVRIRVPVPTPTPLPPGATPTPTPKKRRIPPLPI